MGLTDKNPRLETSLSGMTLDNPVIAASGTFGFGAEFAELYDINILGSFSFKGTTGEARFGNPTPRIAECPAGMLNAVGLQNPGIDHVIAEELPRMKEYFKKPVIANIGGFSVEEMAENCRKIDHEDSVGLIEVTTKPVYIKLSPNVTDIVSIALACEEAGADGISMINTMLGMRIDLARRRPILANKMGGYSGPGIYPVALRMVYQVYDAVRIPIIGMGGISSAENVIEMMMAGASAVQIGAANLVDPYICRDIVRDLPRVMDLYGINTLKEIIGGAH